MRGWSPWYPPRLTRYRSPSLRALSQAAQIGSNLGDTFAAHRHASEAISCAAELGIDPPWPALYALMMVAGLRHEPDEYRSWWAQMDAAAATSGRTYTQLLTAAMRSNETTDSDATEELANHEQLLARMVAHGDPLLITTEAVAFGIVLWRLGDYARARTVADIGLEQPETSGPMVRAGALFVASIASAMLGDHADAAQTLLSAVQLSREHGLTQRVVEAAFLAAALAADRGDIDAATSILAGAVRHAEPMGVVGQHFFYVRRMAAQQAISAHAGDLTAARARGEAMAVDDLVDFVLDMLMAIGR